MTPENTESASANINSSQGYSTGYPEGNGEKWSFTQSSYFPQAWTLITKTIDPAIYASLIELLGTDDQFNKKTLNIEPQVEGDNTLGGLKVSFQFEVPAFIEAEATSDDITHDVNFLKERIIQKTGGIQWPDRFIDLNLEQGLITIQVDVNFP